MNGVENILHIKRRGNMAATRILREDPGCENPG